MKRIIFHWSGGANKPNATDLQHYHFCVDSEGKIHEGKFKPEDNESTLDNYYAMHTGGGNTGSIGIAFCGCYVPPHTDVKLTKYPLTRKQLEAGFKLGAELCKKYKLNLSDPLTIQTHYGFGKRHPNTASAGKIDITYLHEFPHLHKDDIEKFIASKVKWYYANLP